jgi:signal transduction histidine kinase
VLGLTVATWGAVTAGFGIPEPGIPGDTAGGIIRSVLPGGQAWHSGIREGQAVIEINAGETQLDWVLHTRGSGADYYLTIRGATAELRGTLSLALAALLLALVGAAAVARRPRAAAAAASLAGAAGSVPLMLGGNPVISSIGGLLMFGLPVAWLVALGIRARGRRVSVVIVGLAVAFAWLTARITLPAAYDPTDTGRVAMSMTAVAAMVGLSLDRRTVGAVIGSVDAPMALDLLGFALAAGLAISLWLVVGVPPVVVAAVLVPVAAVYVRSRRPVIRLLDRLLFGERLERASVAAIEAERGRLARDIHDEPLQELSGVIRRLETNPAVSGEATALRDVAAHLRAVATDLRPPVLEDLGLGPAIAFLAQQANANGSDVRVKVTLDDWTGIARSARLPRDVELVFFRIAQEAIGNAQRHSRGTLVEVTGGLTPEQAHLTIRDDGVGLTERAAQDGRRRGRLGMASMRERAASIGAEFGVGSASPLGTAVTVSWARP